MDLQIICWSCFIVGFTVLNVSFRWTSKKLPNVLHEVITYGKLRRNISSKWSYFSIKKKWFTLFYAWGLSWNSLILYYFVCNIIKREDRMTSLIKLLLQIMYFPHDLPSQHGCCCTPTHLQILLALLLVSIQTGRRLLECLYLTVFSNDSKIHVLQSLFGLFFYTALGPGILTQLNRITDDCDGVPMITVSQCAAVILFVWSSWHQFKCHKILARIRAKSDCSNNGYAIPFGDWFKYTSSPHYLSEMLIYTSICLTFNFLNVYTFLALTTTISNLLYTSRLSHDWYLTTFKDYPKRRQILIPFVF